LPPIWLASPLPPQPRTAPRGGDNC